MSWRRTVNNFCWFLAAFTITLCVGLASAYASSATWAGINFTFEGDSCQSFLKSMNRVSRVYYANSPDTVFTWVDCSSDPLVAGTQINAFVIGTGNGTQKNYNNSVSIVSIQKSPDISAPDPNEKGYLAWVGLACCWGIGLIAGLQR